MYRPTDIQDGFLNLWGWRQHHNTSEYTIANSLTASSSGQYYQDVHPLLTLDNLKSIAPDFDISGINSWDKNNYYFIGDKVKVGDVTYRCLKNTVNTQPSTNPTYWEDFSGFSQWLEEKTKGSIVKAIRSIWDEKLAESTAKNLLENKALFNGAGRITDIIDQGTNLVGMEIVPIRAQGVTTRIDKVGLQMTGTGNVTVYLMHSSRSEPIKIFNFNRTRSSGMEWFDVDNLYLPYISSDIDAGGSWYLVYRQDQLQTGVQAINKDKDWSKRPCSTCDRNETMAYNVWSKYIEFHPFKTSAFQVNENGDFDGDFNGDFSSLGIELWDVSKNIYTPSTNYGINLQISVECDVTDLFLQQKKSFQSVIGLQVAVDMIRELAYNPNFKIGRTQQNFSRLELLYELDGDSQSMKKSGLVYALEKAMEGVKIDTTSMSRVCFSCNKKGIKYRAI